MSNISDNTQIQMMAETHNSAKEERSSILKRSEISFDFSILITNINENFKNIWEAIQSNQNSIENLHEQIHQLKPASQIKTEINDSNKQPKTVSRQNISNDGVSLNYSEETFRQQPNTELPHSGQFAQKQMGAMSKSQFFQKNEDELKDEARKEEEKAMRQLREEQKDIVFSKILDLNKRIQSLEMQLTRQTGFISRKFNQINNEIEKGNNLVEKSDARMKKSEAQINQLRDELAEYKIKKESKLMKMSSKMGQSSVKNDEFNNYLLSKIQELLKASHDYATKEDIQEMAQNMQDSLRKIQLTLSDTITADELNNTVKIINKKIIDSHKLKGLSLLKEKQYNPQNQRQRSSKEQGDGQNGENREEQQGVVMHVKVMQLQKSLKSLHEALLRQIRIRQEYTKVQNEFHRDKDKRITQLTSNQQSNINKFDEHESFMKKMSANYGDKIGEIQAQIINTQESIEKINNQLKVASFTQTSANKSDIVGNQGTHTLSDQGKIVELQNQVTILKKKYNKLALKLQSLKDDHPTNHQDAVREVQALKLALEKKCDWEGLKKTISYFEERFKEVYESYDYLSGLMKPESKDETTAAKRGWTCLCCDKNIKQFEGKLSQAKFTNIFPSRYESPRIGGYFKQRESDKEYKMLYSNKSKKNSMPHNSSSIKSSSKDELPNIS